MCGREAGRAQGTTRRRVRPDSYTAVPAPVTPPSSRQALGEGLEEEEWGERTDAFAGSWLDKVWGSPGQGA